MKLSHLIIPLMTSLALSLQAQAQTQTQTPPSASLDSQEYTLKGVHCGNCISSMNKKICKSEKYSDLFESCEASLVDSKTKTGKIVFKLKPGKSFDQGTLKTAVESVGKNYSLGDKVK